MYPSSMRVWNDVTPLVAPPNDLWDRLVRWLQVQPGKIDDYTTASNICLGISNKEYCSTRLRILINSLGPRKPRCKFKSSAAPLAIKSDNYAEVCVGRNKFTFNIVSIRRYLKIARERLAITWNNYANNERLLIIKHGINLYCSAEMITTSKLTAPKIRWRPWRASSAVPYWP